MMRNYYFNNFPSQMMGQNGIFSTYANTNAPEWLVKAMFFLPAVVLVFVLWSLFWKGWSLWRAARRGEKGWFVALLVINTLGILEILYLFVFSKKEGSQPVKQ